MNAHLIFLLPMLFWLPPAKADEQKAILELAPSLTELGGGWVTNQVIYLLDPRSHPAELVGPEIANSDQFMEEQRDRLKGSGRTGWGRLRYRHRAETGGDGEHLVYVERWEKIEALGNKWARCVKTPPGAHPGPAIGDDAYWFEDKQFLYLVFRRNLFLVQVVSRSRSGLSQMIRMARVIDSKIVGPVVPESAVNFEVQGPGGRTERIGKSEKGLASLTL
jgi:hypothetical protein